MKSWRKKIMYFSQLFEQAPIRPKAEPRLYAGKALEWVQL
jgi:hypothetical protein